ncbi:MAG: bifunctional hydroxymethylpyrimidine kinase/phosphomethylpyrimidine kinase [Acidobacteria bacterium]|nr:bifunctional hydroxymethylpyrimidine kinase/phosphomethylpyrimidine kinase [Acidobacteriota bacterium]
MALQPLRVENGQWRHRAMIGSGGIGSGTFFALSGNHTLGREESRAGRFLDRRDYCKLHIISHYVQTLLGPGFTTIPIGQVGNDDNGARLLGEMAAASLDTRYVRSLAGVPTLFSFCFVYPDGNGGNLTTEDSASSRVDAEWIMSARGEFERYGGRGVALAVPEVPLAAREALLELGTRHRFLRVSSFTTGEVEEAVARGLLERMDLLAVNRDEAAAVAGLSPDVASSQSLVEAAVRRIAEEYPTLALSITAGRDGSWVRDERRLYHLPALAVHVESTAGAGDAHLSGLIAGLAAGLPLAEAHELAVLVAALSVTSPHTIHPALDRPALRVLARAQAVPLAPAVRQLLEDES